MKIDGKFDEYNAKDRETLVKVGLHISFILCADHNSTPAVPRNMTNYTRSELRINQAFCRAYSGRLLRFNAVLKPARHSIAWVKVKSPVMGLIFDKVHKKATLQVGTSNIYKEN